MPTYILRRLPQAIPLLLILSVLLFFLVRMAPGGPLAQAARNPNIAQEQLQKIRVQLGLDQPLYGQYWR
jgi:peptide/nickel transport system permease protein